jgi:hypothetical protein
VDGRYDRIGFPFAYRGEIREMPDLAFLPPKRFFAPKPWR